MEQLVTRARVVSRSQPQIAALPHVRELLASFLAPAASWTIERAIRSGYRRLAVYLVQELASNAERHELDKRAYVRQCVVPLAAEEGDVALLELLSARFDFCVDRFAVSAAARSGHLEALEWLVGRALSVAPVGEDIQNFTVAILSSDVAWATASSGHLEVLQWISDRVGGFDSFSANEALYGAANAGHMRILEWVQPMVTTRLHDRWIADIVNTGNSNVIRFLHSKSLIQLTSEVMDLAAGYGSLDLLQWMLESGGEGFTPFAMRMAASNGRIDTVRWLRLNGVGITVDAMSAAARDGHLEALQFLEEHFSGDVTSEAFKQAAKRNQLHVVQYLFDRHRDICINASGDYAASEGYLEMIKWLEIHCPDTVFTASAMDSAASRGHLDVVKYLHENRTEGCTTKAMDDASNYGHLDVVEWLHSHRSEGCTTAAMDWAAMWGHLDVVKFLHENRTEGCTTAAMDNVGFSIVGDTSLRLKMVRWLAENCHEGFTARALKNAARQGDVGLLEWVDGRASSDMRKPTVAIQAAQAGSVEVLEWLMEHHPETIDLEMLQRVCEPSWCLRSWMKLHTEL